MAGHSKWHNIQHRKGAQDAKRGKIFTKLIREITVAAKMGGGDVSANPRLRAAVDKALGSNMTRDTIERAVKRGSGDVDGENFDELRYEGYGPNGVAVMVDCLTDNRNRTVSEVRHAFTKQGGNLGTDGSVSYLFTQTGVLVYPAESDEDAIMDAALEAGAEDVVSDEDGMVEVLTSVEGYLDVKQAMIDAGFEPESSELTQRAATMTEMDLEGAEKLMKLVDRLEDLDDVQNVYTNADISDDVMVALS
ncbi:MAG: YebC/PmpR family DNA-binding transcriptional regulator [Gammaproteobacteria bacterium]|jgi:YebC/PmpR family DNA-binding regulatory protein|nr:YebC/PmpR family DNA-binding transcriptional regulator [Gammaproteobacteria bacterium]MBT3490341.1 YebC/PmpR family DNA-binding transcriptional regulator [Gammaproteobacteria bacterium]MBT3718198.1 YebC/PmpR family DNA-binding transcriptional regulator [Gammaproteobacteria bacterium]MBT3846202.1 YebC/PmpR family DNA-binding transcriptional regulator [Gammaproteobacteria bacterium]MBT4300132.1 YebC/PmpR family DNA-binding transcriptional regulator [Gammaproteobacteria bacterium]